MIEVEELAEEYRKSLKQRLIDEDDFERLDMFDENVEEAFLAGYEAGKPKWHKVADGDLPTYGKWIICKMKDGYEPYIVGMTDAIDDVFLVGYETDETNGFENVIAWCEIPKFEK